MKPNPSMTEEEWRWFLLAREVPKLSPTAVASFEKQLSLDESNLDVRVQLLAYYSQYAGNYLKHENAESKLAEQILWFIENQPSTSGYLGRRLTTCGHSFKPKTFAVLRQAWLEQVAVAPTDGTILGNAASFIAWNDIETASDLAERAYALQPSAGWLGTFIIHYNTEIWRAPTLYKNKIRERIVDVGVRSLQAEPGGAPFMTCEYVSDAALSLGRYRIVRWCGEILRNWNQTTCTQMADAYLGLVALKEGDRNLAITLMLKMKRGYEPQNVVFRLARELFDEGERDSIVELIMNFKRKIKASTRNRWLKQIANDEAPDFECFR
ncbi:MAG: hypothetical protein P4L53_20875 [Candidatus Obscuribacterales bacterium]|nr:hypothetical protein [Candidatus Obscuribacterales bacterium]